MKIEVKGNHYAYLDQGEGEVLILLHGFTGRKEGWADLMVELSAHYRVLAFDLPGHGETKTRQPRTMGQTIDDLREIFRSLGLERFHLLGYSMGGRTALAYALTYPETVASLILESASPGLASHAERAARRQQDARLVRLLKKEGLTAFVDRWEDVPLFASQRKLPKALQASLRRERLSQRAEGLADSLSYMGTGEQPSLWNDLQFFKAPVLLIVGQVDEKFVHLNRRMQEQFPRASLRIVEGAGHTVHVENSAAFMEAVTFFIKKDR